MAEMARYDCDGSVYWVGFGTVCGDVFVEGEED